MYEAFYSAAVAAGGQQERLNFIANNLANVNTAGYKSQSSTFADLIKYNQANGTDQENVASGTGIRIEKADTLHTQGGFNRTDLPWDFCIEGNGFFALQDAATGERSYTRDGSFILSREDTGNYYLASATGKRVLDTAGNTIVVPRDVAEAGQTEEENPQAQPLSEQIGVYDFSIKHGMTHLGDNEFAPVEKNGAPILNQNVKVVNATVELSNVDTAREFTRVIESQRAYQYALKMVQTSDEVSETVNGLRR